MAAWGAKEALLAALFLLLLRCRCCRCASAVAADVAGPDGGGGGGDGAGIDRRREAGDSSDEGDDDSDDDSDDADFFPPLIDADDVAHFFSTYDLDGLHWALTNVYSRRSARHPPPHPPDSSSSSGTILTAGRRRRRRRRTAVEPLPPELISRGGGNAYTTEYKLRHDLGQAGYLADVLAASDAIASDRFRRDVVPIYESVLGRIPPLSQLSSTRGLYAFTKDDYDAGIASVYNVALYETTSDELDPGWRGRHDLLGGGLDWDAIQGDWFGEEEERRGSSSADGAAATEEEEGGGGGGGEEAVVVVDPAAPTPAAASSAPGVIVIDDLLSPETLSLLRHLLLRNTHWFQTKTPLDFGKYVGSYIDDGLNDPIFLRLAKEIHQKMPRIMEGHPLRYMWAYKYDSEWESGINLHADMAAVNVNIWLSADGADLMEEGYGGGLVVYTARPPPDWTFESYNARTDHVVEELLRPANFANVTVHHRPNRAVIFDSALFHRTERYRFKRGYENGRINLTLLFGEMRRVGDDGSCSSATTSTADQ